MLQATANIRYTINNRAFRSIEKRLEKSTRRAIKYYEYQIKQALLPIKSKSVGGNFRKVVEVSPEGGPPYSQTLELQKSVGSECREIRPGLIVASCGTDVSYAPVLELGGFPIFEPNRKHSKYRLVNWIKNPTQAIAARPMWIPILQRELKILVALISWI